MPDGNGESQARRPAWDKVFGEPQKGRYVSVVPLGAVAGTRVQPREVEAGSDYYVTVRVLSCNIAQTQFLGTKFTPVIAGETVWQTPDGEMKRVALIGADGNAIGGADPGGPSDLSGATLIGPMPLSGMMALRIGLYAGKWNKTRQQAIEALHAGSSGLLEIIDAGATSPVVNGVFAALKSLFADGNSACYAAIRRELPPPGTARVQTGTWAVISRGNAAPETEGLRLNEEGRLCGADGKPIRAANFVYSITAHTHEAVPVAAGELAAIKDKIAQRVRGNPHLTREELEQMRAWHLTQLRFSNRLVPADLRRATVQVDQMFADALSLWPAQAGGAPASEAGAELRAGIAAVLEAAPPAPPLLSEARASLPEGDAAEAAANAAMDAAARLGKGMKPDTGADSLSAPDRENAEAELSDALGDLAELVISDPRAWVAKAALVANRLRRERQLGPLMDFVVRIRDGRVPDPYLLYFGALAATDAGNTELASALLDSLLPLAKVEWNREFKAWQSAPADHADTAKKALKLHMDALALKGRQWKAQVAALSKKDKALQRALKSALDGYQEAEAAGAPYANTALAPDLDFPRVNILALVNAASLKGIKSLGRKSAFAKSLPLKHWADQMIAQAEPDPNAPDKYDYVYSNAGEASLFLEDEGRAAAYFARYVDKNLADPFMINTARRQLLELWGVPLEADTPLSKLAAQMTALAATGPNSVTLSLNEVDFILTDEGEKTLREAKYDGAAGVAVDRLPMIVELSQSVGIVRRPDGSAVGTGFLLRGDLLHSSFGPEYLFLTNDHVVCAEVDYGNHVDPKFARIHFDHPGAPGPYAVREVLWRSPDSKHDCTILRLTNPPDRVPRPIELCKTLPPRWLETAQVDLVQAAELASRVRIIGHPSGRPKEVTFEMPFFLDHDGPQDLATATPVPVNVHYRAPTEAGSSGSPVFDAATMTLLAIHHSAAKKPLNARRGPGSRTYRANQGKWIQSIRMAIAASFAGGPQGQHTGTGRQGGD